MLYERIFHTAIRNLPDYVKIIVVPILFTISLLLVLPWRISTILGSCCLGCVATLYFFYTLEQEKLTRPETVPLAAFQHADHVGENHHASLLVQIPALPNHDYERVLKQTNRKEDRDIFYILYDAKATKDDTKDILAAIAVPSLSKEQFLNWIKDRKVDDGPLGSVFEVHGAVIRDFIKDDASPFRTYLDSVGLTPAWDIFVLKIDTRSQHKDWYLSSTIPDYAFERTWLMIISILCFLISLASYLVRRKPKRRAARPMQQAAKTDINDTAPPQNAVQTIQRRR